MMKADQSIHCQRTAAIFFIVGHKAGNNYTHYKRHEHLLDGGVGVEWNVMFLYASVSLYVCIFVCVGG